MTDHIHYKLDRAQGAQVCEFWSARVDALERHLSAKTWALVGVTVALAAYPMARMVIPLVLHSAVSIVPDVVRTVLKLI